MFRKLRVAFSLFFLLCSCTHQSTVEAPICLETRGAFDVGSGATKMKVAQVDFCEKKVIKILLEAAEPVGYEADLERSSDGKLSPDVQTRGIQAIQKLKAQAETLHPARWTGVATAAFRKALNTSEYLDLVKRDTGIALQAITQEQEAMLGYRAGMSAHACEKAIVWDIGGGSQQMVLMNAEGPVIFRGQVASVSFRNMVIERVQKKSIKTTFSPNPLSEQQADLARKLVPALVNEIPVSIREAMRDPQTTVIGVGSVHSLSVAGQVEKSTYSASDIWRALTRRFGKSDEQIGSRYAAGDTANLLLVGAMMEQLGIPLVNSVRVDLTNGLFVSPEYWP